MQPVYRVDWESVRCLAYAAAKRNSQSTGVYRPLRQFDRNQLHQLRRRVSLREQKEIEKMSQSVAIVAMLIAGAASPVPSASPDASAFAMLDGTWVGDATVTTPSGRRQLRHTERVGPMLGGALRVIEGKSSNADGSDAGFNAFAVISADERGGFQFRSYAQGHSGTFPLTATESGFVWTMPAGPATIRYTSVVKGGSWHEDGVIERPGAAPMTIFTLDLKRVGDTDWPAAGAVPAPR